MRSIFSNPPHTLNEPVFELLIALNRRFTEELMSKKTGAVIGEFDVLALPVKGS